MWAPPAPDAVAAARARTFLDTSGYSAAHIGGALGRSGSVLLEREAVGAARGALAGDGDALATLVRLFLLGDEVAADDAAAVLGEALEDLARLELVAETGAALRANVELVPHEHLLIASDRRDLAEDHAAVPGLHRPSATLAALTVRRPVERALDVGTGNGVQALLVSPVAGSVVATDVNERALAFAELNAALNGCTNVELRLGSYLEPVAGERFGLVVANPPYVISPESRYVFRDSGLGGDRVSAELVAALPEHLEDGAFASVMVSWIQEGDVVGPRVRDWLPRTGCDGLLLHAAATSAREAATQWNKGLADDEQAYAEAVAAWLRYYREEGIEAIGYGTLVLRRRDGTDPTFAVLELPQDVRGQASDDLELLFGALDAAQDGDAALLRRRLAAPPSARLHRIHARSDGEWREEGAQLELTGALPFKGRLDAATADLLVRLDGTRTVGEALADAAAAAGAPREAAAQGLPLVRRLLSRGFLAPVD